MVLRDRQVIKRGLWASMTIRTNAGPVTLHCLGLATLRSLEHAMIAALAEFDRLNGIARLFIEHGAAIEDSRRGTRQITAEPER